MCDDDRVQRCYETLLEHLRSREVAYGQMGDGRTIQFFIPAGRATHLCLCNVGDCVLRAFVVVGPHASPERRASVTDLVNRINWSITMGNFEIDPSDGEIRFRMFRDARFDELTDEAIEATIGQMLSCVEHFYPALMSVIWNDVAPEDALALVQPEED
ncbi:MAG: YbjN domain-containing protein [bacterium]